MSSIIKWAPLFEPFEDMDKMFENFMPSRSGMTGYVPAVDVYQDKDKVYVETQLAGIDPEKVDISIENDVLIIKGESEKKSEVEEKNYYRKEIRRGSFYRSVPLPSHVIGEKASAEAVNGILKIVVPKAPEAKPKMIKIKTGKSRNS
ncbi:Hsp20/alpha crystallin family protein [Patescibacteria group bacterium]|nr:Hsp20/alpha crystallin family protein [Patescibacteria group bacterium]MBU1663546.1 Hsp20/alpha crystallin family protein [Patescibacteria group bacterium]MBU1933808.1 Hsp20/alpha crystallin family protein [Patescibacteria group bacterium]MBU2007800.1 Hsp20/alpha crystallin family protein [Patescibacteria group bacterium]MBU2233450.1 Hsp20/alpha crystallin family protein [Patescibacteria group bacterium]